MAQTWRVTRTKRAAFRIIDAVGSPLRPLLSPRPPAVDTIRRILVLEPWFIGDLVLATSILRALRERFPGAAITVLGKAHATELLTHSGLVDDVIEFDLPWTASGATSKYDPRRYEAGQWKKMVAELRSRRFDLTIDARMDLRSNAIAFVSGAPRRMVFGFGGGAFLLTDVVKADPDSHHRVVDWMSLMAPLWSNGPGVESAESRARRLPPILRVSEDERRAASEMLAKLGVDVARPIVAIHAGARDARRRWPAESFGRVAESLVKRHAVKIVLLLEPGAVDPKLAVADATLRTTLREMMAVLTWCNVLLCNDSGPMHIADALDVPVVAVFLTGNPVWHRPFREYQKVVGAGTGHGLLHAPTEAAVTEAADEQLARVRSTESVVKTGASV